MFTYKKVSVVFLLLVTVFVSCSEEEPSIIEVEVDKADQYNSPPPAYNDKLNFNIAPITNITNGTIKSIALVKDFDGIVSLVGTGVTYLQGSFRASGRLSIDGNIQVTNISLTKVDYDDANDVSKITLHIKSFPVQKGDRISVVIFENTFAIKGDSASINRKINKEAIVP